MKLQRTWLVQRLNKPYQTENTLSNLSETFAFGGGLINGGLSKEAMNLLRPIFRFDYMGAAEFELGAVPKSLSYIFEHVKEYAAHTITIAKQSVFVIAPQVFTKEIDEVLNQLAKNKIYCKESVLLDVALGLSKYYPKEKCNTIGWLELDNHFMFFVDEVAYKKVATLFGMAVQENSIKKKN